jgi:outer membrane immunogenic protein
MTQYGNIREKSLLLQPDTRLHAPLMLMVRPGILGVIGGTMRAIGIGLLAVVGVLGPTIVAAQNTAPQQRQAAQPLQQRQAPQPRGVPNWSGGQIGGSGGVSFVNTGFVEPGAHLFPSGCLISSQCVETPFSLSGNKTTPTGGLFLGYRWQFGTAVFGIEGDANAESGSASYAFSDSNRFRSESFTGAVKEGADGSIRGRFGLLVTPQTLVYGTGGIAFGRVGGSFSYAAYERFDDCLPCASAVGEGSWSTIQPGATGGAGIETVITPALTLRLEYRYTDFGRFSENVYLYTICASICSSPSSNALINLHANFQVVRLGLGYNF